MNKLLVVCGPTATGKTTLAIRLAKKFNGELISADSRQVYKHMDIGTGKEWGEGVKIWGYDQVNPQNEYSVSQFTKYARKKIDEIALQNKLPILVGGTGLYIKSVVDGIGTISIPRNQDLRNSLIDKTTNQLYDHLATLDSMKAASLNFSDQKNPRRLTRAIEVAQWQVTHGKPSVLQKHTYDSLFVGLKLDFNKLLNKIQKRVEDRMNKGFVEEIESLLFMGVSWDKQSMQGLGYSEAEEFLKKGLSYEEFIEKWGNNENKYAKRQMTWFKKDKRINWFDIDSEKYPGNVDKLVQKWYPTRYVPKS